ncbi:hypothetical protein HO173_009826 [Letharia columbiana]|uniref:Uncharacterized protein n=1 Tax=Letharia columbiana TaxID=112416 RepID=A0A8H6FP25_9LECA|nr:uncharacterized protein HO173_009826 [Letharia columbiana]KAF6231989.1 hypothetical protein HO173_009826 [Letharia columbiana]
MSYFRTCFAHIHTGTAWSPSNIPSIPYQSHKMEANTGKKGRQANMSLNPNSSEKRLTSPEAVFSGS